jgi:hypothetical protein
MNSVAENRLHCTQAESSFPLLKPQTAHRLAGCRKESVEHGWRNQQIVGSPTPSQKSQGTITVSTFGISARRMIS